MWSCLISLKKRRHPAHLRARGALSLHAAWWKRRLNREVEGSQHSLNLIAAHLRDESRQLVPGDTAPIEQALGLAPRFASRPKLKYVCHCQTRLSALFWRAGRRLGLTTEDAAGPSFHMSPDDFPFPIAGDGARVSCCYSAAWVLPAAQSPRRRRVDLKVRCPTLSIGIKFSSLFACRL